jgi:hypothetical protein
VKEHDYKSLLIDLSFKEIKPPINDEAIQLVSSSFTNNMNRLVALSKMPHALMHYATWLGTYASVAHHMETGTYLPDSMEMDTDLSERLNAKITQFMEKLIIVDQHDDNVVATHKLERVISNLDVLDVYLEGTISPAIEAVLHSVVIGAWTAYETMAADLWESCLNARPRLGFVALDAEPSPLDDEEKTERKQKVKYSLPVKLLRKWDYNLKNRMGSLLRGKWDFSRRDQAADAYRKAFGKDNDTLNNIIDDINIRWLNATRNVLVHRAGEADAEFVKLVATHPILGTIKETELVKLDGKLVRELIEVAANKGVQLLQFVDNWLITNND